MSAVIDVKAAISLLAGGGERVRLVVYLDDETRPTLDGSPPNDLDRLIDAVARSRCPAVLYCGRFARQAEDVTDETIVGLDVLGPGGPMDMMTMAVEERIPVEDAECFFALTPEDVRIVYC